MAANKAQAETDKAQTKVRLPADFLRTVKVAAAEHGTTIQQLCIEGLQLRLKQFDRSAQR